MNAVEPAASKPEWRTQIEVTSHYNSGENANLHSGVCAYKPTNRVLQRCVVDDFYVHSSSVGSV